MKSIVCFGDSNTWGSNPADWTRFPFEKRWPGILQLELGDLARVHEEGLSGRTTAFEDPKSPNRNGLIHLPLVIETHRPINLLVIMLGTNDLKAHLELDETDLGRGLNALLTLSSQHEGVESILVLVPPRLVAIDDDHFMTTFGDAHARSEKLTITYERVCSEFDCDLLDLSGELSASNQDGVHLSSQCHYAIGKAVAARARKIFAR